MNTVVRSGASAAVAVLRGDEPVQHHREVAKNRKGERGAACPREWIEKRITACQFMVLRDPDNAGIHLEIGTLYLMLRNRNAAIQEYRILRNLYPSMADELIRRWNITRLFWQD